MASREKHPLALSTNIEGESVKITITPRMFEFAGLRHIARAQIFTSGRSIQIRRSVFENGGQSLKIIDLSSSYLSEVRHYPSHKRITTMNAITLLMYDADEVIIFRNSGLTSF